MKYIIWFPKFWKLCATPYNPQILENTNIDTILQYKVFAIKTLEMRHVSALSFGSSSESVYHYLHNT
jgi:hypothetical protein